ncbi:hypothetical protein ABFS82_10G032500 [Erythranthe guttata]|uniref:cyclin-dependent protein kinase inhibitor SMR3-like n=1 Tax=Erythranthe guttata TaxID=4155 RepID=UPI00064D7837|nr:PREDICTED: cyclin-dependent protein kinase inhibitor SMR3-like [Erythranthe guttata]|eukprot:XP_012832008.1 PREDICTED: cyclin-dependent protein kinase inhibitor SMR3-like [Erythranthe guttata]
MCSEINRFSSYLRRMTSSEDGGNCSPRFGVVGDSGCSCPEIEPEITETAAEEENEIEKLKRIADKARVSLRESEKEIDAVAEDDDGFKTPTSSDHRIPAITECPPAPRKTRPQSSKSKRKAESPPGARRRLQLDMSPEIESIFRTNEDDSGDREIKKARKDDEESSL